MGMHDDLSFTCTCAWSIWRGMPTLHPCWSDSVGREKRHAEQGRGMGAWRSRQGERPVYLRNTNACFLCSAEYEPWRGSERQKGFYVAQRAGDP
jgi:hypothetical protein